MKPSLSFALLSSAALLTACGGSDDDSTPTPPFENYDLSAYEARSISSDTLAGTWVYVATSEYSGSSGGIQQEKTSNSKIYFVIRTADLGDEETACNSTFQDMWINGSEVPFPCQFSQDMTDGNKITGTYDGDINAFEMIKVSDSEEPIGTASYTIAGEEPVTKNIYYFYQQDENVQVMSGHAAGNHQGVIFDINLEDGSQIKSWNYTGVDIEEHDGLTMRAADSLFYMGHDLDEEETGTDTVSFTLDAQSTYSNTITFHGSNDAQDVGGTIQIQLPIQ